MENNYFETNSTSYSSSKKGQAVSSTFVSSVFMWMFAALILTATTAWMFGTNMNLLQLLISETGMTALGWIVMLAPVGLVFLMSFGYNKLNSSVLIIIFAIYSALMGASLGFIFLAYNLSHIFLAFAISSGLFVIMAIAGYTTKIDLSKFGSIMLMGLVGIVIATIVNIFLKSDGLDFIVCFVGVLVFTGLTAYDMQNIKRNAQMAIDGEENTKKMAIMSALSLYMNFINLFLMILRLFGNRD